MLKTTKKSVALTTLGGGLLVLLSASCSFPSYTDFDHYQISTAGIQCQGNGCPSLNLFYRYMRSQRTLSKPLYNDHISLLRDTLSYKGLNVSSAETTQHYELSFHNSGYRDWSGHLTMAPCEPKVLELRHNLKRFGFRQQHPNFHIVRFEIYGRFRSNPLADMEQECPAQIIKDSGVYFYDEMYELQGIKVTHYDIADGRTAYPMNTYSRYERWSMHGELADFMPGYPWVPPSHAGVSVFGTLTQRRNESTQLTIQDYYVDSAAVPTLTSTPLPTSEL